MDAVPTSLNIGLDGVVSTADSGVIRVSDDKGETWASVPGPASGLAGTFDPAAAFATPSRGLVGAGDTTWFTDDEGAAWTDVSPEPGVVLLDAIWLDEEQAWIRMRKFNNGIYGLYKTSDGGQTFQEIEDIDLSHRSRVDVTASGASWIVASDGSVWTCE